MRASATSHMLNMSKVVVTSRVGRWQQRLVAQKRRQAVGMPHCSMHGATHMHRGLDEWYVHAQAMSI